jgi:Bacterial Ig domain
MPTRAIWWFGLTLLLAACGERERLTFPSNEPGDEIGPVTTIDHPAADTVVTEGDLMVVVGRTFDDSGVDTVYFQLEGSSQSFLPFAAGGDDTVTFGLPITTVGLSNKTVTVRIFGVDIDGHRGGPVSRRLSIE